MAENRENPIESTPASGQRLALLVGVEPDIDRRLLGVSARSLAGKRDVQALQPLLRSLGNFPQAKPLIDPDRQQFEEEVYGLASTAKASDVLLLYCSGQGYVDEDGTLYLATANTRSNSLGELNKATAVALPTIHQLLQDCPAQQVVILDCSFTAVGDRGAASQPLEFAAQLGASNRILLTAARTTSYTTAHKQADLSLYTCYLIDAIATGCAQPVGAEITTQHLHRYIQQHMQQATPAIEPALYSPHPEFTIPLTIAPVPDDQLRYRLEVETRLQAGAISEFDRLILNWRRDQLGLSPQTASAIEATVLKPHTTYSENCQRYCQTLASIAQQQYPLRAATQIGLAQYRQQLGLPSEQAEAIAAEVLADPEQHYRQHLQQYEQYLAQQVQSGAWLDRQQRNEFRYLEQQLHLLPQDLAAIKQRHYPAPSDRPIESADPKQPSYARRLQQYRQFFFDQLPPDRPLPPQALSELDSLQQVLQLQNLDVAWAEETAAQQKRETYEAHLQRYLQELLMADNSPASRAQLKQIQQQGQLTQADLAIAAQIAAALNPAAIEPPVQPQIEPPASAPAASLPGQTVAPDRPTEMPASPKAIEVTAEPAAAEEMSPAKPEPLPQPQVLAAPGKTRPARDDKPKPWERSQRDRSRTDPLSSIQSRPPQPAKNSLAERLRDPSLPLRLLKAILFAIVALVVGRLLIAQLLRILPSPIDQLIGIVVFGVVILIAWRAIDRLR